MTELVVVDLPTIIPWQIEPKSYVMNPEDADLIRGKELENGMVVLLEDSTLREEPLCHEESDEQHRCGSRCLRAFKTSRWCRVSKLERRSRSYGNGDPGLLSFVGEYADGSKSAHTYSTAYFWYVKLDSIPKDDA